MTNQETIQYSWNTYHREIEFIALKSDEANYIELYIAGKEPGISKLYLIGTKDKINKKKNEVKEENF